jgi:hypothetical protein
MHQPKILYVRVCVCAREREGERAREKERAREQERASERGRAIEKERMEVDLALQGSGTSV